MTTPIPTQENQNQSTDSNAAETNLVKQRKMYERQIQEERAARQAAEERAAALEKLSSRNAKPGDEEDVDDADDEPYVDKKRLKREIKSFGSQIKQETKQDVQNAVREALAEERKNNFLKQNADYTQVMQPEVLQKFMEKYPDTAENLLAMPDTFERQKLVYSTIKSLGVHKKEDPKPSIQEKIDQNRRSPYYQPSGVAAAPYAQNGDFSPSGQKNAYAKLQELKKNLRI